MISVLLVLQLILGIVFREYYTESQSCDSFFALNQDFTAFIVYCRNNNLIKLYRTCGNSFCFNRTITLPSDPFQIYLGNDLHFAYVDLTLIRTYLYDQATFIYNLIYFTAFDGEEVIGTHDFTWLLFAGRTSESALLFKRTGNTLTLDQTLTGGPVSPSWANVRSMNNYATAIMLGQINNIPFWTQYVYFYRRSAPSGPFNCQSLAVGNLTQAKLILQGAAALVIDGLIASVYEWDGSSYVYNSVKSFSIGDSCQLKSSESGNLLGCKTVSPTQTKVFSYSLTSGSQLQFTVLISNTEQLEIAQNGFLISYYSGPTLYIKVFRRMVCLSNQYLSLDIPSYACGFTGWHKGLTSCLKDISSARRIQCAACYQSCSTCQDFQYCTTCLPGLILVRNICVCPVEQQFDSISKTCIKCSQCKCGPRTFKGSAGCQMCAPYCNQCISLNLCLSCVTGLIVIAGRCTCPQNMFQAAGICVACNALCKKCTISSNICTDCFTGYLLQGSNCNSCSRGCYHCAIRVDLCFICMPDQFLIDGNCLDSCPIGYYLNDEVMKCQTCQTGCLRCNNRKCLVCKSGLLMQEGKCVNQCKKGWLKTGNECLSCKAVCSQFKLQYYNKSSRPYETKLLLSSSKPISLQNLLMIIKRNGPVGNISQLTDRQFLIDLDCKEAKSDFAQISLSTMDGIVPLDQQSNRFSIPVTCFPPNMTSSLSSVSKQILMTVINFNEKVYSLDFMVRQMLFPIISPLGGPVIALLEGPTLPPQMNEVLCLFSVSSSFQKREWTLKSQGSSQGRMLQTAEISKGTLDDSWLSLLIFVLILECIFFSMSYLYQINKLKDSRNILIFRLVLDSISSCLIVVLASQSVRFFYSPFSTARLVTTILLLIWALSHKTYIWYKQKGFDNQVSYRDRQTEVWLAYSCIHSRYSPPQSFAFFLFRTDNAITLIFMMDFFRAFSCALFIDAPYVLFGLTLSATLLNVCIVIFLKPYLLLVLNLLLLARQVCLAGLFISLTVLHFKIQHDFSRILVYQTINWTAVGFLCLYYLCQLFSLLILTKQVLSTQFILKIKQRRNHYFIDLMSRNPSLLQQQLNELIVKGDLNELDLKILKPVMFAKAVFRFNGFKTNMYTVKKIKFNHKFRFQEINFQPFEVTNELPPKQRIAQLVRQISQSFGFFEELTVKLMSRVEQENMRFGEVRELDEGKELNIILQKGGILSSRTVSKQSWSKLLQI